MDRNELVERLGGYEKIYSDAILHRIYSSLLDEPDADLINIIVELTRLVRSQQETINAFNGYVPLVHMSKKDEIEIFNKIKNAKKFINQVEEAQNTKIEDETYFGGKDGQG